MEQIFTIRYPGDKNMGVFFESWVELTTDSDAKMEPETLRRLLVHKLKGHGDSVKSEDMREDIAAMERMEPDDPNYSHEWLLKRMEASMRRKNDEKNDIDYNNQMAKIFGASANLTLGLLGGAKPAAPASGEGGGGGGKRHRSRGKRGQQGDTQPGPNPKAKAKAKTKAKAKAKTKAKAKAGPAPATPGATDRAPSAARTPEQLRLICYHFNHGGCNRGEDCWYEHTLVKNREKDQIPRPGGSRAPSADSAAGAGRKGGGGRGKGDKGKSKGKGKGKDKDKGKGKDGKSRSQSPGGKSGKGKGDKGSKPKLFCKRFFDTGHCDIPGCTIPNLNAEQVAALRTVYGDHFQGYYSPGK